MSIPKAPSSLDNSCAVIHDKTLYTFSPDGFVSLPLKQGAKWKKLPMGEKVTGAKCVGTSPGDPAQAGFFVVGGHSDSDAYAGLQKYTYSTGEWTKITPTDTPTKNRQWHGVTYIKAVDRLVIYAGRRDGQQGPSSETFTIQASEPWEVRSFDAGAQSELTAPILLPWSDADAMMLGGDPLSTTVSLFNQDTQWRPWTTLADPIPRDTSTINAVMVNGEDGSRSLLIFDMGASPNEVKRVVLQDTGGAPVANSAPVISTPSSGDNADQKRDLTLDDWPEYNSTLASTASRTNYAMAQGDDGMVVFVGGNPDEPIAMFDTNENSWLNATNVLVEEQQKILAETSSSTTTTSSSSLTSSTEVSTTETTSSSFSSSTSAESTAAATSTEAVAADSSDDSSDSGMDSNTILGITLGSIIGFLLVLGLLLLCLRRRQRRQSHSEAGHARRASGMPTVGDEKDSHAYANGAVPPTSPGHFRGHHPQGSQDSFSSMAILMGRMNKEKSSALTRKASHDTARTSISSLHKQFKSTISKPIPHTEPTVMEEHEERNLSSSSTALPGVRPRNGPPMPQDGTRRSSGWNRYWSGGSALQILGFGAGKRNTGVSEQSSRYSESPRANPRATQDSATVPPLNFEGRASMHRVNTGSPVVSSYTPQLPIREGMSGKIERPVSRASSGGYSSGIPESVNDAWDPTAGDRPWGADRAPSSAYAPSFHHGSNFTPSSSDSHQPLPPSGVSKQPQLAMASTSDMSWLNLGDQRRV